MILAGAAAWTSSSHSAVKAAIAPAQIDPLSMMAKAKNLPSQESLNAKMGQRSYPMATLYSAAPN
jgi:hypothetical protein